MENGRLIATNSVHLLYSYNGKVTHESMTPPPSKCLFPFSTTPHCNPDFEILINALDLNFCKVTSVKMVRTELSARR